MSEVKYFEIRDRETSIPAFAVKLWPEFKVDERIHTMMGWSSWAEHVYLVHGVSEKATSDPREWPDRTMRAAHQYIMENFDVIDSGSVVDVEHILGESESPKRSQRKEEMG